MRPMSVFRDLSAVADLIELCFSDSMDGDGQRYIADMRRASRDKGFLNWASSITESASLPLTGFVWEEDARIVGNASLIPFRDRGRRIYLIANIAVHPDYRRRGIARLLTQHAMQHGWRKRASALWLHVRDDNPGAIKMYTDLGFQEVARRTNWMAKPDLFLHPINKGQDKSDADIKIVSRYPRFWPRQQNWLRRLYPDELSWYHSFNIYSLRPGFLNWLYLTFVDMNIRQWAAVRGDKLLATLAWSPTGGRADSLTAATPLPQNETEISVEALTRLLIHARHELSNQSRLSLEYPAGEMTDAFILAGFTERRTLLWMRAESATQFSLLRK